MLLMNATMLAMVVMKAMKDPSRIGVSSAPRPASALGREVVRGLGVGVR